jgi:ketosteroid isomerase-like protein
MKKSCLYIFILIMFGCNVEKSSEAMVRELLEADMAFSDLSIEKGMNHAFIYFCANDAVLLRNKAMPLKGAESISESLSLNDDKAYSLSWEPLHATVAKSGDLGYTYGTFTMTLKETGAISKGTYVSVWIMEEGSWKWVLDSGNEGLGPEGLGTE